MIRNFCLATVLSLLVLLSIQSTHAANEQLDPKASGYSSYRWNGGINKPFYHSDVRLEQPEEEYTTGAQAPRAQAVVGTVVPSPEAAASPGKAAQEATLPAASKALPVISREALRKELSQLALKAKPMEIDAEADAVISPGADALTFARLEAVVDQLHTALVRYVIITEEQMTAREGSEALSRAERARLTSQRRALDGLLTKASELHLRSSMLGATSHPKYHVTTLKAVKATLSQMVELMNQ